MFASRTSWNLEPNRLAAALEARRAAGGEVLDLTQSNPTRCGFARNASALLRSLVHPAALHYRPEPRGLPLARGLVAAYYNRSAGLSGEDAVPPERVLLTTSTSEAYSFLFRLLLEPGEEVLVPAPSYPLFEYLAGIQDVRPVPYPLLYYHGWHIDLPSLQAALSPRTRAVVVVHPNNPTGSYVKEAERAELNRLCAERGLALLADEVFLDFAFDGVPRSSFAFNQEGLTFTLSGLSKLAGLPQMKVAWMVASGPPNVVESALQRLEVIADTYLSLNAPVQLAVPGFFDLAAGFQEQAMRRIAGNVAQLDHRLEGQGPCRRLEAEGGWYAVLRVPAIRPDHDLAVDLLEQHGVLVHPGHFFDFPGEGHIVLSLITPPGEFDEGVDRILRLVCS
ncbi:MAG: pyridoxal phosphate-dependent aminotransferase [Terriglobales bacterium]